MKQDNFITIDNFCEKYTLNKNSFTSMKARKYFPNNIFKKDKKEVYVNENYFIYRKESIVKLWNKACDNYYILSNNQSDYQISKKLHLINTQISTSAWSMFFYENLFTPHSEKITHIKITKKLYLFIRYSNWIIRRKYGY